MDHERHSNQEHQTYQEDQLHLYRQDFHLCQEDQKGLLNQLGLGVLFHL